MTNAQKTANRSCFIAAPFGYSTEILEDLLHRANVDTQRFDQISIGSDLYATLNRQVLKADLVLGVLPEGNPSDNVMFELGFASALNRPTLLLVEPKSRIPAELRQTQLVLTQLKSVEALRSAVEGILKSRQLSPAPAHAHKTNDRRLVPVEVETAVSLVKQIRDGWDDNAVDNRALVHGLEREIARLLRQAGATVSATSETHDRGADIAAWVDELQSILGNPMLLEVKVGRLTLDRLTQTETQVRRYLIDSSAGVGVICYLDVERRIFNKTMGVWPLIFLISIDEMLDLVKEGTLAAQLVARRNAAVHGGQ